MVGTLYGIGVGPGDPELITVKAIRILKESPVIAFPKKAKGSKSYASKIIDEYVSETEKEMLGFVFSMTSNLEILERDWLHATESIYEKLVEGKDVAFVTEGDPHLFSTFIYIMKLMKSRHPEVTVKTVPGISSVNGAASSIGISLAEGDEQVGIIPAQNDYQRMKKAIEEHDCVIFIKVAKVMNLMLRILKELDLLDQTSVITKVSSDEEVIWDVRQLEDKELGYLTLMVVRK